MMLRFGFNGYGERLILLHPLQGLGGEQPSPSRTSGEEDENVL